MPVNPLTQAGMTSAATAAPPRGDTGVKSLSSEDFFKLLIVELQQQDPLEPNKTADMIGQVSQIRGIELSKQLTDTLDVLARQQRLVGATELMGKYVKAAIRAQDGSTQEVAGIVTGIRFDPDGAAVLELDSGQALRATDVTHVAPADEPGLLRPLNPPGGAAATAAESSAQAATAKALTQQPQRPAPAAPWWSLERWLMPAAR